MTTIPDRPSEIAISVAANALAAEADAAGVEITYEQRERLARAALEGAWPYLTATE
ncbi:hypothetical protein [Micromonospora sp. CPCC 206061]|uniref:hypothetical protein n=1 Tax=Micromonospora sp. CPCC 206061 TaxID=3122410 RepID=UPI002FEF9ECD